MSQLARSSDPDPEAVFASPPAMPEQTSGDDRALGSTLQQARHKRGWTQQQVADELNVTVLTVSRWERDLTRPHPTLLDRLLLLLDLPAWVAPPAPAPAPTPSRASSAMLCDPALPTVEPSFRGRSDLLHWLTERTNRRHTPTGFPRCVTLVGMPGVGKSTAAAAFAQQMVGKAGFAGLLWASLGPTPDVVSVLSRWATLLGVTEQEQRRFTRLEQWTDVLRTLIGSCRFLLVIDDVWQRGQGEQLAALHVLHTGVYLVTTREPALAVAVTSGPTDIFHVEPFAVDESRALLSALAPEVVASAPAQADALIAAMGGLPLALHLAGKYLERAAHDGSPRRIRQAFAHLARPDARFHLHAAHPFVHDSSRSLYATIQVSDRALSASAQQALRLLALLLPHQPHAFTEEAALAVLNGASADLDTLVDAGLMAYHVAERRYRIHQVIADYAALTANLASDVQVSAQRRLVAYLVDLLRTTDDLRQLERDTETLRLGIVHARALGGPLLIALALSVAPVFARQGRVTEGRDVLSHALSVARTAQCDALPALLLGHGTLALKEGLVDVAYASLREALALLPAPVGASITAPAAIASRDESATHLRCSLLARLGEVAIKRNAYAEASVWLEQGLAQASAFGLVAEQADLLRHIGVIADLSGKRTEALAAYQEGLAAARRSGNSYLECQLLLDTAILWGAQSELGQAKRLLQQGATTATRCGYRDLLCCFYDNLAYLAHLQNNDAQAWAYARKGLLWARQTGQHEWIANALLTTARLLVAHQAFAEAEASLAEAETIIDRMGLLVLRYDLLETRGAARVAAGRLDEARRAYEALRQLALHTDSVIYLGEAEYGLAQVAASTNLSEARAWARLSVEHLCAVGHERLPEIQAWLAALPLATEADETSEARPA